MPTPPAPGLRAIRGRCAPPEIIPLFVCPGMRDKPLRHAVFPHGSGFTAPNPCPAREVCVWYASHDLGGRISYNELPRAALLPANFQSHPFSCAWFRDTIEVHVRRAASAHEPAAAR